MRNQHTLRLAKSALCASIAALAITCGHARPRAAAMPPDVRVAQHDTETPAGRAALAQSAVSEDRREAEAAIARLRSLGQRGLDALFEAFPTEVSALSAERAPELAQGARARVDRVRHALERTARQRDAHAARLFWHTDLETARREAQRTRRPILSLRLLGELDEELSCANSRFFRTALYPNTEVSAHLREHFVLHWSTERAAPRMTIDFGDGRRLVRTITGNSVHYVLDAQGRPVDALPGLYGPRPFLRALRAAEDLARDVAALPDDQRTDYLAQHHARRATQLATGFAEELTSANLETTLALCATAWAAPEGEGAYAVVAEASSIRARLAMPIAVTKSQIERPFINNMEPRVPPAESGRARCDAALTQLAARHTRDAALDAPSLALMRRKTSTHEPADDEAFTTRVRAFERAIAEDTLRNEYGLHLAIHRWFAAREATTARMLTLNERVYTSLFLTPRADPWLGLRPVDVYPAIERDGVL